MIYEKGVELGFLCGVSQCYCGNKVISIMLISIFENLKGETFFIYDGILIYSHICGWYSQ